MLHNQHFSSVAVNTSIYQSSSAAVFILAVFLLGESITIVKVSYCTDTYIYMVLLKDNVARARSSEIATRMLGTLYSMYFSRALLFIVHRTLN